MPLDREGLVRTYLSLFGSLRYKDVRLPSLCPHTSSCAMMSVYACLLVLVSTLVHPSLGQFQYQYSTTVTVTAGDPQPYTVSSGTAAEIRGPETVCPSNFYTGFYLIEGAGHYT